MVVRFTSLFSYLDIVLSLVITLYFATMMAGYSILGFHPVEVMHSFNLKSILLTFGYVGVAHWSAVDGRPQRWM